MILLVIILVMLLAASVYGNIKSLQNIELLENQIENFSDELLRLRRIVIDMRNELKAIDRRGSFEADDEVGIFFKNLKTIVNRLDNFFKNN